MTKLPTDRVVEALENDALIDESIFCVATLPARLQAKKDGQELADLVNKLQGGYTQAFLNVYDHLLEKYRPFYEYDFKKAFQRGVKYEL